MKRRMILSLLVAFIIVLAGCSQGADNSIEGYMKTLTSEAFQGRLTGTEGNDKAAEYIAERLKEAGLEPLVEDSYYHEYEQTIYHPDDQEHTLRVTFEDGTNKDYVYGKDFADLFKTKEVDVTAPTVMEENENVDGKILIATDEGNWRDKNKQAMGTLIMRETFFKSTFIREEGAPVLQITEDVYNELASKAIDEITIKSKYTEKAITARNVVGKLSGTNNNRALVLSAHFDGMGYLGEKTFFSAVDNGSGTAVLLELVKRLEEASKEEPFAMDILFCAFNGEEHGLQGSEAFVEDVTQRYGYDEVYNINIDCVGKKDGGKLIIGGDRDLNADLIVKMKEAIAKNNIDFSEAEYGISDHGSFNHKNMCGISIGQEALSGTDVDYSIHTPQDTLDIIDYGYLRQISDLVFDFVLMNDGRYFKPEQESDEFEEAIFQSPEQEKVDEAINKYFTMREELTKDLAYDEEKYVDIDGFSFHITGNRPLKTIEEVGAYYPDMKIPARLFGMDFDEANIYSDSSSLLMYHDKTELKKELDKVYKREISLENFKNLSMAYMNESDEYVRMMIVPHKKMDVSHMYNLKEVKVNGETYTLIENKEDGKTVGAYVWASVHYDTYHLYIYKGERVEQVLPEETKLISVMDNSEEDIIELIKNFDQQQLIEDLGI